VWREREREQRLSNLYGLDKKTHGREGERKGEKKKRIKNREKGKRKKEKGNEKREKEKKIGEKTPPADGTRGIGKLSALVQNQGQPSHFVLYLTDVRTNTHSSGTEGCEILKQWHRRDDNFFRGKSRISITFRGTKGILSTIKQIWI
jgi:hypothetical protein